MQFRIKFASLSVVLSLVCSPFMAGCGSNTGTAGAPTASIGADGGSAPSASSETAPTIVKPVQLSGGTPASETPARPKVNLFPVVVMKTSLGDITIRLNAEKSPRTVENFLENYVDRGFYEKVIFHYVDKGFMVATGGFTADMQPKPARAEILNEANNGLKNKRGTIAMARHPEYINSATSQFFINLVDNSSLDHRDSESAEKFGYCVFGEIIAGMDVVDRIAEVSVHDVENFPRSPVEPVVIESVQRTQ
jgi:cyclophilin family peptidyl-prolyl cis-trans isomerase